MYYLDDLRLSSQESGSFHSISTPSSLSDCSGTTPEYSNISADLDVEVFLDNVIASVVEKVEDDAGVC